MKRHSNLKKSFTYNGHRTEIDTLNKNKWAEILQCFNDSSIYQSWSYGAVHWGEENLSHFVLKKGEEIIAAAQVRIVSLPLYGAYIAYVARGPLWRRRGAKTDYETLHLMLRALRDEYVSKRGALLRLFPNEVENDKLIEILRAEGFQRQSHISPYRTILNDLTPSLELLKKGLHKRWREKLNRASRNGAEIIEGTDNSLYEIFITLYKQMLQRKRFASYADTDKFRLVQEDLPEKMKMNIMLCVCDNKAAAALVWSAVGDTGTTIFSATGDDGLKNHGAYLLRWRMLERLKAQGCLFLDHGGINKGLNPGGYAFKAGMGGMESCYMGQFDACENNLKFNPFRYAEKLRSNILKNKKHINKIVFGLVKGKNNHRSRTRDQYGQ